MIVSFKFYVMNFVDFVLNCYSHITSHVSQVFGSSTHYTSYSLLNIVHVIVCVFGLTNQVCKYFEFFCKTDLMLENLWRMYEILTLGKLGLKLLFLKNITSHTHAFCSSISMLWGVSKMCLWFFQNCVFPKKFCVPLCFDWSNLFFWSIEIAFKIFRESLSVRSIETVVSVNRISRIRFLKIQIWLVQTTFSKTFQNFFSLSPTRQGSTTNFLSFSF